MLRISNKYILTLIPLKMQEQTKTIQFLIVGTSPKGRKFEERQNFKFLPTATPDDVAQKREDVKILYNSRGYTVEVYTVSPNLQVNIA